MGLRRPVGTPAPPKQRRPPALDPVVADELRRGYADDIELLIARTGLDVGHWLPGRGEPSP